MIEKRQLSTAKIEMDNLVSYILMSGVLLSIALLTVSMIWRWVKTGSPELVYSIPGTNLFSFLVSDFKQFASLAWRPRLLENLGIAILLLTPYLRVLASFVYFAVKERNLKYSVFTGIVLAVLTYSLYLR